MRADTMRAVVVTNGGRPAYEIPLAPCWQAYRALQLTHPGGEFDSHDGLAAAADVTRSTVSRFLSGGRVSLPVARRIVATLGLDFAAVAQAIPVAAA